MLDARLCMPLSVPWPPPTDCSTAHDPPPRAHYLSRYLFGCIEDRALLPQHLRALYAPSYAVYCATEGHAELPPDFVSGDFLARLARLWCLLLCCSGQAASFKLRVLLLACCIGAISRASGMLSCARPFLALRSGSLEMTLPG